MKREKASEKCAMALLFNSLGAYKDKSSANTSDTAKADFKSIHNTPRISVMEIFVRILKILIWGSLRVDGSVVQRTEKTNQEKYPQVC